MPKIPSLLLATTVILAASTSVFGLPQKPSNPPDISFAVFFNPGAASLSKEGREIISIAAKRFTATHRSNPAAHIFVSSETDDQDNAPLLTKRIKTVSDQLVRDGIQKKYVSEIEQPTVHAKSVRLLEALDRRVSISIQENADTRRTVG